MIYFSIFTRGFLGYLFRAGATLLTYINVILFCNFVFVLWCYDCKINLMPATWLQVQISIVFCWLGICNKLMEIWKFLSKMGNNYCEEELLKKTCGLAVGQQATDRLPMQHDSETIIFLNIYRWMVKGW